MDLGMSFGALALLVLGLAGGGLFTGILAGLFGVGGGAVLVPVLYELFSWLGVDSSVRMHVTLGTSLAIMIPTSLKSVAAHRARGAVDDAFLRRVTIPVVLGVIIGILVVSVSPSSTLKWVWVVCACVLAAKLLFGQDGWCLGPDIPKSRWVEVYAWAVGLSSTLMSTGGGAYISALMMAYGRSIHQAVATSSGIAPMIAIPGVLGYMWAGWGSPHLPTGSLGYVNLIGAAIVIPISVLAAPLGVRMAHGIPRRKLELAFGCFLGAVGLRYAIDLIFF